MLTSLSLLLIPSKLSENTVPHPSFLLSAHLCIFHFPAGCLSIHQHAAPCGCSSGPGRQAGRLVNKGTITPAQPPALSMTSLSALWTSLVHEWIIVEQALENLGKQGGKRAMR